MPRDSTTMNHSFAENVFKYSEQRNPTYSGAHPVIPRLYVQEWKNDMKNRDLIVKNAEVGGIPYYEHDENLYFEKREQMSYNVEDLTRVDEKYSLPDRAQMLRPAFYHETSTYLSELMFRKTKEHA